jgi:hypothetical protein
MTTQTYLAETIKERVTFREAAERYGLEFNRVGAAYWSRSEAEKARAMYDE